MNLKRFVEAIQGVSRGDQVDEYLNSESSLQDPVIRGDLFVALLHIVYGTSVDIEKIFKGINHISESKIVIPNGLIPDGISTLSSELIAKDVLEGKYAFEKQTDGILIYVKDK